MSTPEKWEQPVNLLSTPEMKTMADVMNAGIVVNDDVIHALRLIPIGGIDVRGIKPATFWSVPAGDTGETPHEDDCPVCRAGRDTQHAEPLDDIDVPF